MVRSSLQQSRGVSLLIFLFLSPPKTRFQGWNQCAMQGRGCACVRVHHVHVQTVTVYQAVDFARKNNRLLCAYAQCPGTEYVQ